eukprot:gene20763-21466_t
MVLPGAQPSLSSPSIKLRIEDLTCRFGDMVALSNVNLEIRTGEFVCILGASGCGKSTLFNAVSGLLRATSGRIVLDGNDVSNRPGQVGYMLQKDLMLPWRTVLGNITLAAALTRGATEADRVEAARLATRYDILPVDLPRPRSVDSLTTDTFIALKREIMGHLYHDANAGH